MGEPTYHPVTLIERWDEAADLLGMRFASQEPALAASFELPGQYVSMRARGEIGYMALASRPGEATLELLVRPMPSGIAASLAAMSPGEVAEMSCALGPGWPVQRHKGKDLLLFAAGSGISPIRSLLWWLAAHRADYRAVSLFHGARTRAHLPYRTEMRAWEQEGVTVVRVLAEEPAGGEAGYAEGFVQEALAGHTLDPANAVAYVCGMPAMVEGVTAALAARGVGAEQIFLNY